MTPKPADLNLPTLGILKILHEGKGTYVFSHLTSWVTGKKEVENLEAVGRWFLEAAAYLREQNDTSHRDL